MSMHTLAAFLLALAVQAPLTSGADPFLTEKTTDPHSTSERRTAVATPVEEEVLPDPLRGSIFRTPILRAPILRALGLEARVGRGVGEYQAFGTDGKRSAGGNWHMRVSYAAVDGVSVYAGYGHVSFDCEGGFCTGNPVNFTGRGAESGVRLDWRALWVEAGVFTHAVEATWSEPGVPAEKVRARSDLGVLMGAGFAIPVVDGLLLVPGVRWMRHQAAFEPAERAPLAHALVDVGFRYQGFR